MDFLVRNMRAAVETTVVAANDTLTTTVAPSTGDKIKNAIMDKGTELLNTLSEKMHSSL